LYLPHSREGYVMEMSSPSNELNYSEGRDY
jgi:hypothetical protein